MRRRSQKRQELIDSLAEVRDEFRREMGGCAVCGDAWLKGAWPQVLDVHEIVGGGVRQRTYADRRAWLALCRHHHDESHATDYARQYALKFLSDREHYDRQWLNSLRGDPECVAQDEVDLQIRQILEDTRWR